MNSKKTVAVATLGLLAGCGGTGTLEHSSSASQPDQLDDSAPNQVAEAPDVAQELEILAQLNIVHVGALVRDYPEGAMNCYGPCPGFEDEIAEEDARQALRLQELVDIATEASSVTIDSYSCSLEVIDDNLAALDGLDIVEVFGLVEEVPQNNPYCYNLPCPEDIEAAEEINCQRATALATIVAEATEL
ncbi:MAG TPA: hypothetical protein DIU15_11285 [Deltaproteobacteria bacterium]|nr:hypothetical protein [Deltaproteobacteria bacterium]HCP46621.1 hypothetical protein [Deltaproteobacteria bacterium]